MYRSHQTTVFFTSAVFILGLAGCSSPWPPAGGERAGAHPQRTPSPISEGSVPTLLNYARDFAVSLEDRELQLPGHSQAICAHALKAAAQDDMDSLLAIVTSTASFGLTPRAVRPPHQRDGRRFEPLSVHAYPELFMQRLRDTGSTMSTQAAGGTTKISCGRELPAVQDYVSRGAEPMWCSYTDASTLSWINFSLIVTADGPKINYVATTAATPRAFADFGAWPPPTTTVPTLPADPRASTARR
jgi:hypothetical protein